MKLVKSSNQIPITAYACCKYHETTNYKVLQFLFNQSNCLITIKYSVQPIKLLNYHQTTPFNQSNCLITIKLLRSTNPMARSLYIYVIIIMNFLTLIVFSYLQFLFFIFFHSINCFFGVASILSPSLFNKGGQAQAFLEYK